MNVAGDRPVTVAGGGLSGGDEAGRLARQLTTLGHCDGRTIERGRRVAEESGQDLPTVLIRLGLVTERALAETYASLLGRPIVTGERYPAETPLFAERLTAKFLRAARALPIAVDDGRLLVACVDPLDRFTLGAIAAATGMRVIAEAAMPIELDAALNRLYPQADLPATAAEEAGDDAPLEEDAERLKDLASEAPVIRLVNGIIARAVETGASDIHFEPFEDHLRVRFRHDGVLHEVETHPARLTPAIISRVKIMSRLDIAERRLPQDGRIKLAVRGTEIDFRVSTVPSLHGETVVIRVLDRNAVVFDYAKLGLPPAVVEAWSRTIELQNGIVLVTGPTGSGKTTTLYTGLLALNSVRRKLVTIEDPIEYQLAGITQIQVREQIGLRFDTLLSRIVRQDPDVIMVGEIRNLETAQIAMQAALTGHMVLSTLHTNSAAATITRLRDMGVEDYLMTAVLRGILAQRLVRRLCPDCRRPSPAPASLVERFRLDRRGGAGPVLQWHAAGCAACRGTGYRGRSAIAEFLVPNTKIEHLIFTGADHLAIERAAVEAGMATMFESGMEAAIDGLTTIEEVVRTIRAES